MKMELALAAVPLSDARPYMKGWNRNNKTVKLLRKFMPRYNKKGYRAYFSLDRAAALEPKAKISPPSAITSVMMTLGYGVTDYIANRCIKLSDPTSKNEFKITGVIAKAKSLSETQKKFYLDQINNDPRRQASKEGSRMLVVSCHPYDIIGMSTGRGWTSCMNIDDGSNNHYVARDLAFGVMVVYAIDSDDTNIQHPICRCLIKPFKSGNGHTLYHRETRIYGTPVPGFDAVLNKFLRALNRKAPPDYYEQVPHLYKDGSDTSIAHKGVSVQPVKAKTYYQQPAIPKWFGPDDFGKFIEDAEFWVGSGEMPQGFKFEGTTEKEKDFLSMVLFLAIHSHARVPTAHINGRRLTPEQFDALMEKYNVKHAWHGGTFSVGDQRHGLSFTPKELIKNHKLVHYQNPAATTGNHISKIVDDYMDIDTETSATEVRAYLDTLLGAFTKEVDHITVMVNDRDPMVERETERLASERAGPDASAIEDEFDNYHPGYVEDLLNVSDNDEAREGNYVAMQEEAYDNVDNRLEVYRDHAESLYNTLVELEDTISEEMSHAEEQQNDLDEDDEEYEDKRLAYEEIWNILDDYKSEFSIIAEEANRASASQY